MVYCEKKNGICALYVLENFSRTFWSGLPFDGLLARAKVLGFSDYAAKSIDILTHQLNNHEEAKSETKKSGLKIIASYFFFLLHIFFSLFIYFLVETEVP